MSGFGRIEPGAQPSEEKDPILEMFEKATFNDLVQLVGDPAKSSADTIPPKLPDSIKKIMEEIRNKKKEKTNSEGAVIFKIENCSQEYLIAKNILAYHLKNNFLESTGVHWFDNLLDKIKTLKVIDLDPSISKNLSEKQNTSINEKQSFINEFYSKKSKALVYQRNKEEFFESEAIFSENIKRLEKELEGEALSKAENILPKEIKIKILELSKKIQEKSREIEKEKAQFPKNSGITLKLLKEQTENLKNFSTLSVVIKKTGITDAIDKKFPQHNKATNSMYTLTQYPFQRILRYKTLLQDTLKNIKKSDHPERIHFEEVIKGEIDEIAASNHKTDIGLIIDLVWSKTKECNAGLKEIDEKEKKYHHALKTILKNEPKSNYKTIQNILKYPSPENICVFLDDANHELDQSSKTKISDLNMAFYKDAMEENPNLTKLGLSYTDLFLYEHTLEKPKEFAFGFAALQAEIGKELIDNRNQVAQYLVDIYNALPNMIWQEKNTKKYYLDAAIKFIYHNTPLTPDQEITIKKDWPDEIKEYRKEFETNYTEEKKLEYIARFNKVHFFTPEEIIRTEKDTAGNMTITIQGKEKKHLITLSKTESNGLEIRHYTIDSDNQLVPAKLKGKISAIPNQLTLSNIINKYPDNIIPEEKVDDFLSEIKKYCKKNYPQAITIPTKNDLLGQLNEESSSNPPDVIEEKIEKLKSKIVLLPPISEMTDEQLNTSEKELLALQKELESLETETDSDIIDITEEYYKPKPIIPSKTVNPVKPKDADAFFNALAHIENADAKNIALLGSNLSAYVKNQILDRPIADSVDAVFFYLCVAKRLYDQDKIALLNDILNGITDSILSNPLLKWSDYEGYIKEMRKIGTKSARRKITNHAVIGENEEYLLKALAHIKKSTENKTPLQLIHQKATPKSPSTEYIKDKLLARTQLPSDPDRVFVKILTLPTNGVLSFSAGNNSLGKKISTKQYQKIKQSL